MPCRTRLVGEKKRLAGLRRPAEQATAPASDLKERMIRVRLDAADPAADQPDLVADQAEVFAAHLEASGAGHANRQRLRMAPIEREIAAVEQVGG